MSDIAWKSRKRARARESSERQESLYLADRGARIAGVARRRKTCGGRRLPRRLFVSVEDQRDRLSSRVLAVSDRRWRWKSARAITTMTEAAGLRLMRSLQGKPEADYGTDRLQQPLLPRVEGQSDTAVDPELLVD